MPQITSCFSFPASSFSYEGNISLCRLPARYHLWSLNSELPITHNSNPPQTRLATQSCLTGHLSTSPARLLSCPISHAHFHSVLQIPSSLSPQILRLASLHNCVSQFSIMNLYVCVCVCVYRYIDIHPISSVSLNNPDKYKHLLYTRPYSRHCGFSGGTRHTKFSTFTELIIWRCGGEGYNVKNREVTKKTTHELKHKEGEGGSHVYM